MANSFTMVNGDLSQGPHHDPGGYPSAQMGSLEDTLQQMNVLIKENRDLKEALKQTNTSMKERFEGLSAWKEKQREERDFLEGKLAEAKERLTALTQQNEELNEKLRTVEGNADGGVQGEAGSRSTEVEALKAQIARLQAEKSDLVALNSELQLKTGQGSPDDSFIEIRIAEGEVNVTKDFPSGQKDPSDPSVTKFDLTVSRLESEELTVSQLLQSLRKETQKVERLETELQAARERILKLEPCASKSTETQTSLPPEEAVATETTVAPEGQTSQEASTKEHKADSEVESLNGQMRTLLNELQQVQSKLDDAEHLKKNLQDRCRDMEQDLNVLRTQLVEKQQVRSENEQLKLQLESMQSVSKMEQKKAEEDRKSMNQLKDAYTKLFEDFIEVKEAKKIKEMQVSTEQARELQARLAAAEQALAAKQQQIDEMKQEIVKKEQDLDTISAFKAQAEVYSSDFFAERAAREKIHEEKERLAAQLEYVKKQHSQLREEMESLGRQSVNEMQRRHLSRGANPQAGAQSQGARGAEGRDWQKHNNIPEHVCPKCNEHLPDLDTLQIHIMDCII